MYRQPSVVFWCRFTFRPNCFIFNAELFHLYCRSTHRYPVWTEVSIERCFSSAAKHLSATHATTVAAWKVLICFLSVIADIWWFSFSVYVRGGCLSHQFCVFLKDLINVFWQILFFPFSFQKSASQEEWVLPLRPSTRFVPLPHLVFLASELQTLSCC